MLQHPSSGCRSASKSHHCQLRASKYTGSLYTTSVTDVVSVGVHAYGGEPNEASVIGTAGNVFEDFVLAVQVRNDSIKNARVKVSRSRGLIPLPNFSTFTVYPSGSTASRQHTPVATSRSSRIIASSTSDDRLSFDVDQWTDDQMKVILQQLNAKGLMERPVRNAGGKNKKHPEEGLSTFPKADGLVQSPESVDDDESPVTSSSSWSDLDET